MELSSNFYPVLLNLVYGAEDDLSVCLYQRIRGAGVPGVHGYDDLRLGPDVPLDENTILGDLIADVEIKDVTVSLEKV